MNTDNYMRPSNLKIIFRYGPLYWIIWLMQRHALASEIKYRAFGVVAWIAREALESNSGTNMLSVAPTVLSKEYVDFFKELERMHNATKLFWQKNPIHVVEDTENG